MNLEISNCNNISLARITLTPGKLNIKFAPNGTGKSTIAAALVYCAQGDETLLKKLTPFKLRRDNPDNKVPQINGATAIKTIMCFNEVYVSQFVFKPDELLSDSFDILIRNDAYKQREQEIEALVKKSKQLFIGNPILEELIINLKEMGSAFKLTNSGLSKSSMGMKGLSAGNMIQHVPPGLEHYTPFIQSTSSVNWVDWQTKGCDFTELSDNCPFCTANFVENLEQIKMVGRTYDKNVIRNLIALINVIDKLGEFFSEDTKDRLNAITLLKDGLDKTHIAFLVLVKTQIEEFIAKLEDIRTISAFQFKDGEKVAEKLLDYKLNFKFFSELDSSKMRECVAPINDSIDEVIKQAGQLQGKINQQRIEMKRTIELHQEAINGFLATAGYNYKVEIVGEGEQSRLRLRHDDHEEHISGGSQHLSFGERNAFSLVLFMYECLAKRPDLIILDDPISSFDKNKKYAILEMLFRRDAEKCLKNKTVLMLTHDMEPIIDTVKALSDKFYNQTSASFLKCQAGVVSERLIDKNDVKTFGQICTNVFESGKDQIIKLVYLRRHLEIVDKDGDAYQVLSNIFKKRARAIDFRVECQESGEPPEMESAKFDNGCEEIAKEISDFVYTEVLERLTNERLLRSLYHGSTNGYEKLQIFRLIEPACANSIVRKFINETYHIENEFICQLDPTDFDTIPEIYRA